MAHDNNDMLLLVGRMDAKLDLLLVRHDKHEQRIAKLEAAFQRAFGVATAVATSFSIIGQYLVSHFMK